MTVAGWLFMVVSIGFVVALTSFCFVLVLRKRSSVWGPAEPPAASKSPGANGG